LPDLCTGTRRICNYYCSFIYLFQTTEVYYYVVAFCYQDVTVRDIRGR